MNAATGDQFTVYPGVPEVILIFPALAVGLAQEYCETVAVITGGGFGLTLTVTGEVYVLVTPEQLVTFIVAVYPVVEAGQTVCVKPEPI